MTSASEPDPADEVLAAALRDGDDTALDALMLRWQVPLRSFLHRHLHNEADALDLAQETFVRIYRHRASYRQGARFSTWMFQIALNLCRDHGRRRKTRPFAALDEAPEQPDARPAPDTAALCEERVAAIRTAIASLPENLRAPLLLSTYQHLSHIEIAETLHTTPKAVENRLARARELLRKSLARFLT